MGTYSPIPPPFILVLRCYSIVGTHTDVDVPPSGPRLSRAAGVRQRLKNIEDAGNMGNIGYSDGPENPPARANRCHPIRMCLSNYGRRSAPFRRKFEILVDT